MHYIELSEIVQFVKASILAISLHWKISTLFVVSHFLSAKVSPEWRLNPGFRGPESVPFALNRGVSSTEVIDKTIIRVFLQNQTLCSLYGGVPWIEVSQRRGSTAIVKLYLGVWCLDIPLKKVAELTCKLSPETLFAAALLAPSCAPFDALWAAAPP